MKSIGGLMKNVWSCGKKTCNTCWMSLKCFKHFVIVFFNPLCLLIKMYLYVFCQILPFIFCQLVNLP